MNTSHNKHESIMNTAKNANGSTSSKDIYIRFLCVHMFPPSSQDYTNQYIQNISSKFLMDCLALVKVEQMLIMFNYNFDLEL